MKKLIGCLISIFILLGFFFGAYQHIETKYALSAELEKTKQRLDYKIVEDQRDAVEQQIWKMEDRCKEEPGNTTARESLRELKSRLDRLIKKLDVLEKK